MAVERRSGDNAFMTSARGDVSTVYLGRYTWEHANDIAGELEDAGIFWWYKQPGFLSQVWEFGAVRLFVDRSRLDDAKSIAARILEADAAAE